MPVTKKRKSRGGGTRC